MTLPSKCCFFFQESRLRKKISMAIDFSLVLNHHIVLFVNAYSVAQPAQKFFWGHKCLILGE